MYANSRYAARPRVTFRTAGGSIYKFAHPFLAGQIGSTSLDEVNISSCLKLNDTYFNATPAQDSSFQELLVDGSVITVTNHAMAGQMTLNVLPTTGTVGGGDLVAIAHFIIASKDSVGGTLTREKFVNGDKLTRIYYGVSFKNVPHEIEAGNAVAVYPVVMLYAGWIEGISKGAGTTKKLWAVGNKYGLEAAYVPFTVGGTPVNESESSDYYGGAPVPSYGTDDVDGTGIAGKDADSTNAAGSGTTSEHGGLAAEPAPAQLPPQQQNGE
jgi:hypothetical protein